MSDPKVFNYTESNDGVQVDVGTFFSSEYEFTDCENGVETPIDLTDLTLTGTINTSEGTLIVALVEVLDNTSTGFYITDAVNGRFIFQLSQDLVVSSEATEKLATYDIRYTDALLKPTTFLRGNIQFLNTASS